MSSKVEKSAAEVAAYMNGSPFANHERILALVEVVREERKYEYDKLLEDDNYLRHYNDTLVTQINQLNEKVVAARAEGKAEGAAEERERIRGASQMVGVDEDCIKFIGSVDNYVGAAFLVPVDVMDPPVLAPTKEKP